MSGYLTLPTANPTLADHATRKGYVDSRIDSLSATVNNTGAGGFVRISGSTMVGDLILNTSSPSVALQASSKGYVDTRITSLSSTVDTKLTGEYLARAGGTMLGTISMNSNKILALGTPTLASDAATKGYVDTTLSTATSDAATNTYVNQQDALRVAKIGDTMTGPLVINASNPINPNNPSTLTLNSGNLYIRTAAPTVLLMNKNARPTILGSLNSKFTISRGSDNDSEANDGGPNGREPMVLNLLDGNVTFSGDVYAGNGSKILATKENADSKLPLAGGTLTNFLTLHANPTQGTHAANKTYVDAEVAKANGNASGKVSKTGDTMSGSLILESSDNFKPANLTLKDASQLFLHRIKPAMYFRDVNNRAAMLQCGDDRFYIRRCGINGINPDAGPNSREPMLLNLLDGNVTFSGDVTAYSDSRLKKNIIPIENALDKTLKLEGVSYERKESDNKHIGLIAQKVKEVLPEVVNEDKDGYFTVSYGNIVGLLVEAIKELNAKVEKLENKNI
jgi:hypothetical protein